MTSEGHPGDQAVTAVVAPLQTIEKIIPCVVLTRLRNSAERVEIRTNTGSSDEDIETMLLHPAVRHVCRTAVRAYLHEQIPALVKCLVEQARQGQAWAWKILVETTAFGGALQEAMQDSGAGETSAGVPSCDLESDLMQSIHKLLFEKPDDEHSAAKDASATDPS
ncbi:MAG: hypothetical protein ACRD3M_02775 [Thermoanaerobaculia bacterium]